MICVNLYGGAGAGKSTIAAFVFAELKTRGILCELVGSPHKELSYDRSMRVREDEPFMFATLAHRLYRMKNYGLQVAVCDYPVFQAIVWSRHAGSKYLFDTIIETYGKYDNMDFLLERNVEFWKKDCRDGNLKSELETDKNIENLLSKHSEGFEKLAPEGYKTAVYIANKVEQAVKERKWLPLLPYITDVATEAMVDKYGRILNSWEVYENSGVKYK